ncbi:MAG: hypothetical protein GC190_20575 [Alphaproteobacteria bacterium]|nr:hypothetical protein [Alphaproteobacteria bacterium]
MIRDAGFFAAGLALGCAVALVVLSRVDVFMPWDQATQAQLASLSTKDLGRVLMGRVGARFIQGRGPDDGAVFYDAPKPYSAWLCRANRYFIASKIVRGYEESAQEFWDDDLQVKQMYGVWKRPTAPDDPTLARETACAKYHDFDHLIYESTALTAERAVYVMDVASQQARSGRVSFAIACKDERRIPDKPCDAAAILRDFDLKRIYQVWMEKEIKDKDSYERVDQIFAEPPSDSKGCPGGWDDLSFRVRDVQHIGKQSISEADVESIDVLLGCVD